MLTNRHILYSLTVILERLLDLSLGQTTSGNPSTCAEIGHSVSEYQRIFDRPRPKLMIADEHLQLRNSPSVNGLPPPRQPEDDHLISFVYPLCVTHLPRTTEIWLVAIGERSARNGTTASGFCR